MTVLRERLDYTIRETTIRCPPCAACSPNDLKPALLHTANAKLESNTSVCKEEKLLDKDVVKCVGWCQWVQ